MTTAELPGSSRTARSRRAASREAAATVVIALGVVMLMQPFSLDALQLVLRRSRSPAR